MLPSAAGLASLLFGFLFESHVQTCSITINSIKMLFKAAPELMAAARAAAAAAKLATHKA